MGELITASNLNPIPAAPPAIPGAPLPQSGGFNINMSDIKEILSLVKDGIQNFKEIQAMRAQFQPAAQNLNQIGGTAAPIAPGAPPPTIVQEVKMIQTKMTVDRVKLKTLLSDLITNQANKLPNDIKERKISELIGENWNKFTYKHKGVINIDSNFIMETLVEQLGNAVDDMLIVKEAK